MLLSYVCKSVRASDGTRGPTGHKVRPRALRVPNSTRRCLLISPTSVGTRGAHAPRPPGLVSSRKAGSFEQRLPSTSRVPASVARVPGPDAFRSACLSSQPALGVGPRRTHPQNGVPHPHAGPTTVGDAASGCPCPRPSEEADGAARFLTFCTEFSFVITPIFT